MWSVLLSKTLCFCVKTVPDSKVTNAIDKSENLVKATRPSLMLNLNTIFVIIVVKLLWNHEAQLSESTTNKTILLMQHCLYSY